MQHGYVAMNSCSVVVAAQQCNALSYKCLTQAYRYVNRNTSVIYDVCTRQVGINVERVWQMLYLLKQRR